MFISYRQALVYKILIIYSILRLDLPSICVIISLTYQKNKSIFICEEDRLWRF